jgi:hypothetical protein
MQGAGKITFMMRHLRTPGQPQEFAVIVLDHCQYNAGVGFHRLEQTQTPLPHLEGILMPTVQEYLSDIKGLVQIAQATIQPLQQHSNHLSWIWVSALLYSPNATLSTSTIVGCICIYRS